MNATRTPILVLLALAACAGAGAGGTAAPEEAPGLAPDAGAMAAPATTGEGVRVVPLPNGMPCYVTPGVRRGTEQIEFGVFAGSLFVAPGVAELAAYTLLKSTDPTRSTRSLEQRIHQLGGSVEVRVGLTTTWFDIRVLGGRAQQALTALRESLENVTTSRTQITRMRDELVAERTAQVVADPVAAAARVLLQAEPSTSAHLNALLDLDPNSVVQFHSRLYRPGRTLLSIRTPRRAEQVLATVSQGDQAFGRWAPPPPLPGQSALVPRQFEPGLYWSEDVEQRGSTSCAIVLRLPDATQPTAAEWLVLHACLTLDGVGGRLEQLQDEAGLSHLQWDARFERTPDVQALVMTTKARPAEIVKVWQLLQRARQSLVAVPPSRSELQLALKRATLNAGLAELTATDSQRLEVNMAIRGKRPGALEARIAELADPSKWDLAAAAAAFQETPAWVVAVGPGRPDELRGLVATDLLPKGFDPATQNRPTPENLALADPWLAQARAATGGEEVYRRLGGFAAKATVTSEQGLVSEDAVEWSPDGALRRTRTVLGQTVATALAAGGGRAVETMDGAEKTLSPRQATLLRREWLRHPQMLLAAHQHGERRFRPIAQRKAGDREFYIVEDVGDEFDRLRVHIDTESRLIRVVESWEQLEDQTLVHIREEWSDYRPVDGLRVPHRRRTTWNDGQLVSETQFSEWRLLDRQRR